MQVRLLFPEAEVTKSLSNLLKHNSVVIKSTDKMVIDSNQIISDILQQQMTKSPIYDSKEPDKDGFVCGLDAVVVEQLIRDEDADSEIDEETPDVSELLEEAKQQAEEIIREAKEQSELMIEQAKKDGYDIGFNQGRLDLENEISNQKKAMEEELQSRRQQLEQEYIALRKSIESELVDTLLEVFMRFTRTEANNKKEMILYLVDGVMRNTELSKEFLIKVSEEDYKFLLNSKDKIYRETSDEIHIDICKDTNLRRNECIIETDAGVFDCSLDIQLDNLANEIRLLSCMNQNE